MLKQNIFVKIEIGFKDNKVDENNLNFYCNFKNILIDYSR